MRKLFVILCIFLFPLLMHGQTIHTVMRGETAASIAQKYGVSEEELGKANPKLAEFCYVGMQLTIPVVNLPDSPSIVPTITPSAPALHRAEAVKKEVGVPVVQADEFREMGNVAFKKKQWGRAAQYYKKSLSADPSSFGTWYNLGSCQYNRGRYKQAVQAYQTCLQLIPEGSYLRSDVEKMLSAASEQQELKSQKRKETLANIGTALAVTAAAVGTIFLEAQMLQAAGNTYPAGSPAVSGGSGYSGDSGYDGGSGLDGNLPATSNKGNLCLSCGGLGKCDQCHGSGNRTDNSFGTGSDPRYKCGVCGGDGKCPKCGGLGRIYK